MLNASLRCLEVFVTAVDSGSFSAAAEQLDISQPSVSTHVSTLERDVGGPLFTRKRGSRPTPTELGRSVYAHAREMLANARNLRADVVSLQRATEQRVVVSCQRSLANSVFNTPLANFALVNRKIQLVVRIGKQEDVLADMQDGFADIGSLISDMPPSGIRSEIVGRQKLVFIAAPTHRLARKPVVTAKDLNAAGFILPPPDSLYGKTIARLIAQTGLGPVQAVAHATEYPFMREFVSKEVGIAIAGVGSVQADVERGTLAILKTDLPELEVNVYLLYSDRRKSAHGTALLAEALRTSSR